MEKREHTIDAKGKRIGRVATEASSVLLGKDSPDFAKNVTASVHVRIENARLLDIPEKRAAEEFERYSGYPGGLKRERLGHLAKRRGHSEVLRRVISGMLPKNRLRKPRMKNLEIID